MPLLPDFLIIGAARSGTTTLHSWLQEHPQVYVPAEKIPEPHFFLKSCEYAKGLDYYRERWFSGRTDEQVAGEASVSYMFQPVAFERIRQHLPDCRFLVLLRHPIERAYSSYWRTRSQGLEPLSFDEAIRREPQRTANAGSRFWQEVQPHAYLGRSLYASQLEHCFRLYPRERFCIELYEDLVQRPVELAARIYRFLGVDDSVRPRDPHRALNATEKEESVSTAARTYLRDMLGGEITRLEQLLDRDLSAWRN